MTDPTQAEWRSLGAVWQSRPPLTRASATDLASLAGRQDEEWRRAKRLIGIAWLLALSLATWLMVSTPFKGLAVLLGILISLTFVAAARLARPEDESGRQGLVPYLQKTVTRQESLVGVLWAGAAVSMAALATVLFGASRLLLVAPSQPHGATTWIALGVAALYALAGIAFCGSRAWLARAELERLARVCRHLRGPTSG